MFFLGLSTPQTFWSLLELNHQNFSGFSSSVLLICCLIFVLCDRKLWEKNKLFLFDRPSAKWQTVWVKHKVDPERASQGRPTGTGRCCTASSVGREATPTTSCGPNASAPLPVHAGETGFHWLTVQEQHVQRVTWGHCVWNAAVFWRVLQQRRWQDVVCVETHRC